MPGLSQGTHQPDGPEMTPISESTGDALLIAYRVRGVTGYRGLGHIMGCKGKTPWNCTRLATGCLGEGQKVEKGRDQSDLGSYQRGKIEGIRE